MSTAQHRTLEKYVQLMNTNATAQLFHAAHELGLFEALATGQKEAEQLADACQAKTEPIELLADALCTAGILEKYGDDYALAPVIKMFGEHNFDLGNQYWSQLVDFARTGDGLATTTKDERDTEFRASTMAAQWTTTPAALSAIQILNIGTDRKKLSILDLGGGSALTTLTILHVDPTSHATVVDWRTAVEKTLETAQSIGVDARVIPIAGDYQLVDLEPESYDLVVLSNVLQLLDEQQTKQLLSRCFAALRPAGEVAIIDVFSGQDAGKLTYAISALNIALRTQRGRVCQPTVLQSQLGAVGYKKPVYSHLPVAPYTMGLMVASKPESD
ncbi:MAG: 2-polyprenyl-3-methyl-5-hydroxy-6-metoxy-1,4-benzoquinol methylase [Pirellulaceae bacterium]|jgi:2-polyprenyl-3-methyl-5-hydroxy-6-metoxy-1,4-benzoquinol methylase